MPGDDCMHYAKCGLGLVVMIERAHAGREVQAAAALAFAVLARPQSAAFVASCASGPRSSSATSHRSTPASRRRCSSVAVVLVALAPWIGADPKRLRVAGALFALAFALSLPAVIAPVGAQLVDRDPAADGPQIVRRVTVLPQLARTSTGAVDGPREGDYRRHLALWQAGISRQAGVRGPLVALVATGLLPAALLRVARPLAGVLRGALTAVPLAPPAMAGTRRNSPLPSGRYLCRTWRRLR